MASKVSVTLSIRRRWWYEVASATLLAMAYATVLFMSEYRHERMLDAMLQWIVDHAIIIECVDG